MLNSPASVSNFWKERIKCENSLQYSSTLSSVRMGMITNIPVSHRFASRIKIDKMDNPFDNIFGRDLKKR